MAVRFSLLIVFLFSLPGYSWQDVFAQNTMPFFPETDNYFKLIYTSDKKPDVSVGPVIANQRSRLGIYPDGNLYNFQFIGNHEEVEFVPVLSRAGSMLYFNNKYYNTSDFDSIIFENNLTFCTIYYSDKTIPVSIMQKTFYLPNSNTVVRRYFFTNTTKSPIDFSFLELPEFTLGDPYYTVYNPFNIDVNYYRNEKPIQMNGYNGFFVINRLNSWYAGSVYMNQNPLLVWTLESDFKENVRTGKFFNKEQTIGKACDESVAILQSNIKLKAGETKEIDVLYSYHHLKEDHAVVISALTEKLSTPYFQQVETDLLKERDNYFIYKTGNPQVDALIAVSAKTVEQSVYIMPDGKITSIPGHMYPRLYTRDSHWHIRALLAMGNIEAAKGLIEHLMQYQYNDGGFPTRIELSGNTQQHTKESDVDSPILTGLSLLEYFNKTRDTSFLKKYIPNLIALYNFSKKCDIDGDGFLEQKENQDWADVSKREGKVTYCQALWYEYQKQLANIPATIKPKDFEACSDNCKKMESTFDNLFWDAKSEMYCNYIKSTGQKSYEASQDVCLAFVFGLVKDKDKIQKHIECLRKRCHTNIGIATMEPTIKSGFDPVGFYVNGGSWLWESSFEMLAASLLIDSKYYIEPSTKFFRYYFGDNPYHQVYFDPIEWYNSYNGNNCEYYYKSSKQFTTGPSSFIWMISSLKDSIKKKD